MHAQLKAVLKFKLQDEQSSRIHRVTDAVIVDGCAMLWTVHWFTSGTVVAYVINFMDFIRFIWNALTSTDIWSYVGNSTKQITRSSRPGNDASHQGNMQRYRCLCPADSLLSLEKYDNECQHGEPMCWVNNHIHQTTLIETLGFMWETL